MTDVFTKRGNVDTETHTHGDHKDGHLKLRQAWNIPPSEGNTLQVP